MDMNLGVVQEQSSVAWISPNSTRFTLQLTTLLLLDNGSEKLLVGFVPLLRYDYFSFLVLHNHFLGLEIAYSHGQDIASPLQIKRYLNLQLDKNFLFP